MGDEREAQWRQLLEGNVDSVREKLAALGEEDLTALEQLEAAGKNRAGVLNAIEDRMLELASDSPNVPPDTNTEDPDDDGKDSDTDTALGKAGGGAGSAANGAGKRARGEEQPAWQKREYTGPLTIDQAQWRRQHIRQK